VGQTNQCLVWHLVNVLSTINWNAFNVKRTLQIVEKKEVFGLIQLGFNLYN
jgi:hypothetical protein